MKDEKVLRAAFWVLVAAEKQMEGER